MVTCGLTWQKRMLRNSDIEQVCIYPSNHSYGLSPSVHKYYTKGWDRTKGGFPLEMNRVFPKCKAAIFKRTKKSTSEALWALWYWRHGASQVSREKSICDTPISQQWRKTKQPNTSGQDSCLNRPFTNEDYMKGKWLHELVPHIIS